MRNAVVFKEKPLSLQRAKTSSFLFLLWSETKKPKINSPSSLAGFIDRVGCRYIGVSPVILLVQILGKNC